MAEATMTMAPVTLPARSRTGTLVRWCRRNPVTALGFAIVLILALLGALAPVIAPYNPHALNPAVILKAPSGKHWFGTGLFGEDIFSKVIYGVRIDFAIGLSAVAIGLIVGSST